MSGESFFTSEEITTLVENYSKLNDYELETEYNSIISTITKLVNEKRQYDDTLKREKFILERDVQLNPKVVKLTYEIDTLKGDIDTKQQNLSTHKDSEKAILLKRMQDDEDAEIAEIRLKYERKRQEVDTIIDRKSTNPQRGIDCLLSKLRTLQQKLDTEKQTMEKTLEQRMSKPGVVAMAMVKEKESLLGKLQYKQTLVEKCRDKLFERKRLQELRKYR